MIKSLFNISDLSSEDINNILNTDEEKKVLQNKNLGLLFEKHSTRTRLSFAVGIAHLGGNMIDLRFEDLNISRNESFEDTFKAFNCYLDGLIFRTSDHKRLELASKFFHKPIINALSDKSHPCQTISDLFTLKEHFGTLNLDLLWMGDMNNVCFSLVEAVNLIKDLKLTICTPIDISSKVQWLYNDNIKIISDINDINLGSIDCVMTDVFISMNDNDNHIKIEKLKKYAVTNDIMKNTKKNSIFMHCLPAELNKEVSEIVFKGEKSIVWKQAHNRLVAQKKLLQYVNW